MSAPVYRDTLLSLIPHQGSMCLWDQVDAWDGDSIALRTASHTRRDNPLCSDGRLRAVHLCEYGAQAMAAHGGLLARERGTVAPAGMLVALRGVELHVARIDELIGDITCQAELLASSTTSQQYAFRIEHISMLLATGRAAVMLDGGQG